MTGDTQLMERNIFHEFNVERLSPYLRVRRGRSDLAAAQEATRPMMRARRPELGPPPPPPSDYLGIFSNIHGGFQRSYVTEVPWYGTVGARVESSINYEYFNAHAELK